MQENRNGTFEDIKPFSEFMEKMVNMKVDDYANVKAFHFGTEEELEEIKTKKSLENKVDHMQEQIDELKSEKENQSKYFVLPTTEEIKKYSSKGPIEKNMLRIMRGIAAK